MPRHLHIGPGNFFRAHQAVYTQTAGGWPITAVSLRNAATRDALAPQGFDYALAIRDAAGERLERIDVIDAILVAPEDPDAVLSLLTDPEVAVVTITVTEKGYDLHADGTLDLAAVQGDLDGPPRSLVGVLAHGLARRTAPLTVLSCDNLSGNGRLLRGAVAAFAEAAGLTLAWDRLAFPDTMVDRITPRTPTDLSAHVAAAGLPPAAPVATEGFTEWVIEDAFAGPRPDWAAAGARIVPDVTPFETRKLRMLNGAHSYLAYAGLNRGFAHVHEAVADPDLRAGVAALMGAAARTVEGFDAAELSAYADALLARFDNPSLRHALAQIAMDGSQKMPIRILAPLRVLHGADGPIAPHVAALAAWCDFVRAAERLDDPRADALAAAARGADHRRALCRYLDGSLPDALLLAVEQA
ncbi:mannitol dehydrogenase family protein [Jannaschia marina]|uniref:mannitol dehydrogenase family protein n=1 Tax=Jannaschia marina TaxID=2741674 RepID=UPI0015CA47F4|nr:mannitol dehydrogenase family protein [Jannaschia marina]